MNECIKQGFEWQNWINPQSIITIMGFLFLTGFQFLNYGTRLEEIEAELKKPRFDPWTGSAEVQTHILEREKGRPLTSQEIRAIQNEIREQLIREGLR